MQTLNRPSNPDVSMNPLADGQQDLQIQERRKYGESVDYFMSACLEGWNSYIEMGLDSEFYELASRSLSPCQAAQVTLLKLYLDTFPAAERRRLEEDGLLFYESAGSFIKALQPCPRELEEELQIEECDIKALFLREIRELLKTRSGSGMTRDRHAFLRAALHLSTSLTHIIETHDLYKEFMFRVYPQYPFLNQVVA